MSPLPASVEGRATLENDVVLLDGEPVGAVRRINGDTTYQKYWQAISYQTGPMPGGYVTRIAAIVAVLLERGK